MAQKPRKNGKNDDEANETGSFTLLSTAEIADEAGVPRRYIGRLERAEVIEKSGHGRYKASEVAKILAFPSRRAAPGLDGSLWT
jgi:hypothetical protein